MLPEITGHDQHQIIVIAFSPGLVASDCILCFRVSRNIPSPKLANHSVYDGNVLVLHVVYHDLANICVLDEVAVPCHIRQSANTAPLVSRPHLSRWLELMIHTEEEKIAALEGRFHAAREDDNNRGG